MRKLRNQAPQGEPERDQRPATSGFWCEWSSTTHNRCHKLAYPGQPFCAYHVAAAFGMARGASHPDEKTRALFDDVYEDEDQEVT